MKFLILGGILFFMYRFYFRPSLNAPKEKDALDNQKEEFSDYEEIE